MRMPDRDLLRRSYLAFCAGAGLWPDDVDRLLRSRGVVLSRNRLRELGRDSDRGLPITAQELWTLISAWADEQRAGREMGRAPLSEETDDGQSPAPMTPDPSSLGMLLERIGWTTGELAARLGIAPATVRDWVSGRRAAPPAVLEWVAHVAAAVEACGPQPEGWSNPGVGRRPSPGRSDR